MSSANNRIRIRDNRNEGGTGVTLTFIEDDPKDPRFEIWHSWSLTPEEASGLATAIMTVLVSQALDVPPGDLQ